MAKKTTTRSLSILAALAMTTATFAAAPTAFAAAPTTAQEAAMVPTPLTRIVDSRDALGVAATPENNKTIDIKVAGNLNGDDDETENANVVVPADADAVVVNLTAVDASEAGFFTAWPKGGTRPATSNINFMAGDTIANGATIPVGDDGSISMFTRGSADVLVDIAGYYREDSYVDLADTSATRLYDSRLMPDGAIEDRSVTLINTGAMEGDILTLNITADQAKGAGYATVWGTQETPSTDEKPSLLGMPLTSNLNYAEGQTVANTVQVKAGKGGYVSIYTMTATNLVVDQVAKVADKYDHDNNDGTADDWDSTAAKAAYEAINLLPKAQRVMDTRIALGSDEKEGYRSLDFKNLVGADLDDLGSIVLNVTVDNAEADGFVSIGANLEEKGIDTSVLNFKAGQIIANRVVIPASFMGDLEVYSNVPTDIIVDVMGYTQAAVPPQAVTVDASELEPTIVAVDNDGWLTSGSISNKTAIAVPAYADELANLDGKTISADASDFDTLAEQTAFLATGASTVLDGNVATIIDEDGNETEVKMLDHSTDTRDNLIGQPKRVSGDAQAGGDGRDGKADFMLVPLTDLPTGDYKLRVPLITNESTPKKGMYETAFTISSQTARTAAPFRAKTVSRDYDGSWSHTGSADLDGNGNTADGLEKDFEITLDGKTFKASAIVGSNTVFTAADLKTYVETPTNGFTGMTVTVDSSDDSKFTISVDRGLETDKSDADLSVSLPAGETTPTIAAVADSLIVADYAADASPSATQYPLADDADVTQSEYVVSEDIGAWAGQSVTIETPAAFKLSNTDVTFEAGSTTLKDMADVTFDSKDATFTAPKRTDFVDAKDKEIAMTNSLMAEMVSADNASLTAATKINVLKFKLNMK